MALTRVTDLIDEIEAFQLNQYAALLEGDTGEGHPVALTALDDATNYAFQVANQDATNGRAMRVLKANLTDPWIDVTNTGVFIENLRMPHISTPDAPGSSKLVVWPGTDDTLNIRSGAAGAARRVLDGATLQAAGDLLYASAANTPARLALPTKGYAYLAGATAPIGDPLVRKNYVYNYDFRVQQQTILGSTDNSYHLDRWRLLLEAANAAVPTQDLSDVPSDGSRAACKLTVGSGNNNKCGIWQILPYNDVVGLRTQVVSLQFKAKATDGITDMRAAVVQWSGTLDSVSGDPISSWGAAGTNPTLAAGYAYVGTPVNLTPTTSWATYKVENLTLSSPNNLAVLIWSNDKTTTQTTDILRITDVQVEEGAICTSMERRPYADELARCLPFFEARGGTSSTEQFASGYAQSTTQGNFYFQYMARKRIAPTITVSADADFAILHSTSTEASAITPTAIGLDSCFLAATVASGLTAGQGMILRADTTTNARINISAEL